MSRICEIAYFSNTYSMGTHWRKSSRLGDRTNKRPIGRWRSSCSIGRSSTRVISEKCLDVRVRSGVLAKLMLPVQTERHTKQTKLN
jgi:hypothetical protein